MQQATEIDYKSIINKWLQAAEQGNASAQYNLGVVFQKGQGVEQDYKKAAEWYLKAAEQGKAQAQFWLGFLYQNGMGVTKDYGNAFCWYLKAAEQGNVNAQSFLGALYYHGKGIAKDESKAILWLTKASEQGDKRAKDLLSKILANQSEHSPNAHSDEINTLDTTAHLTNQKGLFFLLFWRFLLICFFPIISPILRIKTFFVKKEFLNFIHTYLAEVDGSSFSLTKIQANILEMTGFDKNIGLYFFTLSLQALVFIVLPLLLLWLNKKNPIHKTKNRIILTMLSYVLGHICGCFLWYYSVACHLTRYRFFNIPYPDYDMLLPFLSVILDGYFLLRTGKLYYICFGLLGILSEVYIIYVIWTILTGILKGTTR